VYHTTQEIATYLVTSENVIPRWNVHLGNNIRLLCKGILDIFLVAELIFRYGDPVPLGGFRYASADGHRNRISHLHLKAWLWVVWVDCVSRE
jgi:hypothetical protein